MSYSFANQDGSFLNEQGTQPVAVLTPLTGTTIALSKAQNFVFINPAATIAALTVMMPPQPAAGQSVTLSFGHIVTALTIQDASGNAVAGAAAAGAVGVSTTLKYIGGAWVKWD
jgi:hypothetical protein